MRSATLAPVTYIMAVVLSLAFPLPAHAGKDGYRLLELDGYKVKWGDLKLGAGASVSYAFARETLHFEDATNCRDLVPIDALVGKNLSRETLTHETAAAFRVWERAAGLSFHEVEDVRDADIILGGQGEPSGRAYANVSYAADLQDGVRAIEQALVCLNPTDEWKVGFNGDQDVYDIRYTLIHEIGHAIGLDHPGPTGQVMAFRYTEAYDNLQPGDLRGVQLLYGRATDESEPIISGDTSLTAQPIEVYPANSFSNPSGIRTNRDKDVASSGISSFTGKTASAP